MPRLKTISVEKAQERLEALCVRSEHCTAEIRRKLQLWAIEQSAAEKIVAKLVERRFVDDRRYTEAFVRDKLRFSYWGRIKIAMHLRANRIDSDIIKEALSNIEEELYLEILRKVITTKSRSIEMTDYSERQKLYRWGVSRGFESPLVAAEVRRLRDLHKNDNTDD